MMCISRRESRRAQLRQHRLAIGAPHLQHRAQLLVEQHRQHALGEVARERAVLALVAVDVEARGIHRQRVEIDGHAGAARERHLAQRREEAAVGAVVVREDAVRGVEALDRMEEGLELLRVLAIGRAVAELPVHLRERRAAEAVAPAAEVDEHRARSRPGPCAAGA